MQPAAIALNYNVENIQNDVRQKIISYEKSQFNSLVWGSLTLTPTKECNALLGEPERAIEVCCRLSSTVEDSALNLSLRRTWPFSQYQDTVIRERIEVYANCELL